MKEAARRWVLTGNPHRIKRDIDDLMQYVSIKLKSGKHKVSEMF